MTKVLVIGGGIGGLAAAVALRQRGLEAAVYEAAPELLPVGKGIWVPTNAMLVLLRLGLDQAVRRAGWSLERIEIRSVSDGVLQEFDLKKVVARYGQPTVSIHRAALVELLAGALPPGTLHLGKRCSSLAQDRDGVTVQFTDGTEARGEIVIGADGIRSRIREHLWPGVKLRYRGQTCYRGVADWELPAKLDRTCWEVWGGKLRIGFSAIGPRQIYWFAPITAPADSPAPPEPLSEWLARQYGSFSSPVPEMLRHTPAREIIRTDLYDLTPLRHWTQGRVALLGDAAHAMTPNLGQGGAQAIEDAYVLAEELARSRDPAEAFRAYERVRLPKVRWIVKTAARLGWIAHLRARPLEMARNWMMKNTPQRVNEGQFDRLYRLNY